MSSNGSIFKRACLALIRFYQRHISPLSPPCCRFIPSCSTYTYQAIERFGIFKGCALGAWRILRCGPWTPGGYDPVPEKKAKYKKCRVKDCTVCMGEVRSPYDDACCCGEHEHEEQ